MKLFRSINESQIKQQIDQQTLVRIFDAKRIREESRHILNEKNKQQSAETSLKRQLALKKKEASITSRIKEV